MDKSGLGLAELGMRQDIDDGKHTESRKEGQ